jgi:hypothetical protein
VSDDAVAGEQPAYDPTGLEPAEPMPGEEPSAADGRALPPLREVAEIRKPSTVGGVIYLCVLGVALAGIGVAATGAWRTGVSWLAVSLLAAAATRVVLDDDHAGMLRVRRKLLDALILSAAGVALLVLVATIPDQPR